VARALDFAENGTRYLLNCCRALDPKQFGAYFCGWVSQFLLATALTGQMAIDIKTIQNLAEGIVRSAHIVSAFSTGLGVA
jgi:hypothetical protein